MLIFAQIQQESNFQADLIQEGTGALGLMQLMPSSFTNYTKEQLLDPETNIKIGCTYLKDCIDTFKKEANSEKIKFGLAAYNAGAGNIINAQNLAAAQKYPTDKWAAVGPCLVQITGLNNALQTNWYVHIIMQNYTDLVTAAMHGEISQS